MKEKHELISDKESEIMALQAQLYSHVSQIGDWKIIKCYEASLQNKPMPYDLESLQAERQNVRNRINQLQEEIEQLK